MDVLEHNTKDICTNFYKYLLNLENVNGIGYGYKYINNKNTFKPCLHVLVNKKAPKNYISTNNFIPKNYMGIATDVIEVKKGKFTKQLPAVTQKFRPLQNGASIGNYYGRGTLGCVVTKPYYYFFREYFILSNNHVMANFNQTPIGSPIFQPDTITSGEDKNNIIATLSDFVPLIFTKESRLDNPIMNEVDCAIAKLNSSSLVSNKIYGVGPITDIGEINLNENVKKVGFKTGLTEGYIKTLHVTTSIEYDNKTYFFKELILNTLKSDVGDSGSIVVNKYNEVLGLLFASADDGESYMTDINLVLSKLNVSLYLERPLIQV